MNWCKTCKKELPNEAICHAEVECSSCKAKRLEKELEQAQREREEARAKLARAEQQLKIDNEGNQDWINSLCEQLCKMEDALGFKNDCYDKKGQWVPTIGPWLERVRDLLAAEGEVGDLKDKLAQAEAQRERMKGALEAAATRFVELLEVSDLIDDEEQHQTKAIEQTLVTIRDALNPAKDPA